MRTLCLLFLATACAHEPLVRFKEATGGARWESVAIIETKGTAAVGGLSGPFKAIEDVRDGRRRTEYRLGPIEEQEGFDGQASWSRSGGGEVVVNDGSTAVAMARTETWMTVRGYWRESGASYSAPRTEGGLTVIEARPEGGVPIELRFDAATGLLIEARHQVRQDTIVQRFSDYRDVGGIQIPFTVTIDSGEPRNLVTVTTTEAKLSDSADAAAFARPETDAAKVSFTGSAKQTELPFELANNHIYVNAEVDGKPARLLVDTGGANILTPRAAERLGIASEGKMAASGVGEQKIDYGVGRARSLVLGEVRVDDPVFVVIDLGTLLDVEGFEFDGLVGYEVFHRFAVRIDYPASKLTLIDPSIFSPPPAETAVPFQLNDTIPLVDGEIDGIPARFSIDTGSRSSLSTHSPFTKQERLVEKYGAKFETVTGWGVGGPLTSRPVRFSKVKIGPIPVEGVVGDLFTGEKGAFADPDHSANLGGGILRRFIVTFDYAARRMFLEPGPDTATRENYDRAGMFLMLDRNSLRIAAVAPSSPAAKAGLQPDDHILMIDAAPIASRSLSDWRAFFRNTAPKTKVVLTIQRNDIPQNFSLTLEDLIP